MFKIQKSGFIDAVASALIFGAMPLFTKSLFSFGLDPISSAFYRMSLSLIFIYAFLKFHLKYDMSLNKQELKSFVICALSFVLTSTILFSSYNYISAGAATSIHFVYPVVIFIAVSILHKKRPNIYETICIILASVGLILITDFKELGNIKGIVYAFLSAFTYAFYSIYLEKPVFADIKPLKILFYMNLFGALLIFLYSIATKNYIYTKFNFTQFFFIFLYSLVLTVGATFLYQRAVRKIGAKYTSILSTLEPINSIILGFIFSHEILSPVQCIAATMIILATFILIRLKK